MLYVNMLCIQHFFCSLYQTETNPSLPPPWPRLQDQWVVGWQAAPGDGNAHALLLRGTCIQVRGNADVQREKTTIIHDQIQRIYSITNDNN